MSSDDRVRVLAKHGIRFFLILCILVVEPHLMQTGAEMGAEIFDYIESAFEVFGGRCRTRAPFLNRDADGIGKRPGRHEERDIAKRRAFLGVQRWMTEEVDAVGRCLFAKP